MHKKSEEKHSKPNRMKGVENRGWKESAQSPLSHSRVHYLMAIETLRAELGYARTTDIADMLEVSRGASSMALAQLKKRGWVTEDPNRFLLLTEEGRRITQLVFGNFNILKRFFEEVLGLQGAEAEACACKMEHLISFNAGERIALLTELVAEHQELRHKIHQYLVKHAHQQREV